MGAVVEKPSHPTETPDGGSPRWRPPTVALARPTDSLELRVVLPYGTAECELESRADVVDEAGQCELLGPTAPARHVGCLEDQRRPTRPA